MNMRQFRSSAFLVLCGSLMAFGQQVPENPTFVSISAEFRTSLSPGRHNARITLSDGPEITLGSFLVPGCSNSSDLVVRTSFQATIPSGGGTIVVESEETQEIYQYHQIQFSPARSLRPRTTSGSLAYQNTIIAQCIEQGSSTPATSLPALPRSTLYSSKSLKLPTVTVTMLT